MIAATARKEDLPPRFAWLRTVCLNAWFWPLALTVTALFAVFGGAYVTLHALVLRDHRRTLWLLRRTIPHYGAAIMKCAWPGVRVRYVDHAPQDQPPFVFVANHLSFSDSYLMAYLPGESVQVVNIWPFRIPLLGVVARLAGYLSIREMPFTAFLEAGSRLLEEGVSLIVFPEGTRSRSGRMGPFHGAAFRLAQQTGAKIVPLAIAGNARIPPPGSMWLRCGRVRLAKLPAITADQYKDMSAYKLKHVAQEAIRRYLEAEPI